MRIIIILTTSFFPLFLFANSVCDDNIPMPIESSCSIMEEICDNNIDDDGDGFVDCDDPDLATDCCCYESPILELDEEYFLCEGEVLEIDLTDQFESFSWSNLSGTINDSGEIISIDQADSYMLTAIDSCDNMMIEILMVTAAQDDDGSLYFELCHGFTVVVNEVPYNTGGEFEQMLTTVQGCDSTLFITIDEIPAIISNLDFITCPGDSITVNQTTYYDAGAYTQQLTSGQGCDSTIHISYEHYPVTPLDTSFTICIGDTLLFNNEEFIEAGEYTQSLTSSMGCDSTILIEVLTTNTPTEELFFTLCPGDSVEVNNETYFDGGTFTQSIDNGGACDSILLINIESKDNQFTDLQFSFCEGDSVIHNNIVYNEPGNYTQLLETVDGCDSTLLILIEENPAFEIDESYTICTGDSLELNGEIFNEAGSYVQLLLSEFGCDSILNIKITENPTFESDTVFMICLGDSVFINGNYFHDEGNYTQTFTTVAGCDSIINIDLDVLLPTTEELSFILCHGDSIIVNEQVYHTGGSFEQLIETDELCDSLLIIDIEEKEEIFSNVSVLLCEGDTAIINNEIYYEPGSYTQLLQSVDGCDSTLNISISQIPAIVIDTAFTICEGESIIIGEEEFTETGIYEVAVETGISCDIIFIFDLTVNNSYLVQETYAINPGEEITINGETFDEPGIFVQELQTVAGCDSTIITEIVEVRSIVHYCFDECVAWLGGDNQIYTEFQPIYPDTIDCAEYKSSNIFRENPVVNSHSCTDGLDGTLAICVSSDDTCDFDKESEKSLVLRLPINPDDGSAVQIHTFDFYQQAPETFNWTAGPSGINNYPTLFGLRVTVENTGAEIYFEDNLATSTEWEFIEFDFSDNENFLIKEPTILRFEMLAYCLAGSDSEVTAWDIEDLNVSASCRENIELRSIGGQVTAQHNGLNMEDVEMILSGDGKFTKAITDGEGSFAFQDLIANFSYDLYAYKDDDCLNGVSTLDLLQIKNHILGLHPFENPDQYVAADVNNDLKISAQDLIELRKLILGIHTKFPENTSWRFVDADYPLNVIKPWNMKETIRVNRFALTHDEYDFLGIKIGDVNRTANAGYSSSLLEDRSSYRLVMDYDIQEKESNICEITFSIPESYELSGGQLHLEVEGHQIMKLIPGACQFQSEHYRIDTDELVISWDPHSGQLIKENVDLFSIIVRGNKVEAENAITLKSDLLSSEWYVGGDLDIYDVALRNKITHSNYPAFKLLSISPNPFINRLQIDFVHAEDGLVKYQIIDLLGNPVTHGQIFMEKGESSIILTEESLPVQTGGYILRMEHNRRFINQKVMLVK